MIQQAPEYYRPVSEMLSNILDNLRYSRSDRERKVRIAIETELFMNMGEALRKAETRAYLLGSRGEGSTGPGLQSDIDILFQSNFIKVVTDLADCQPDKDNYLMVKDNFTHPGYVKLQKINLSPDNTPVPIYHSESANKILTIDSLNRTVMSNTIHHHLGNVSGPALHHPANYKELSSDIVYAVRCSQWPREGYEWFQRRRLFGWPTPQQIKNALEYGCFATPVGHPHSSEPHLTWRLSFSEAERDLTRSFEDTEIKVYILLKMIKETFIKPLLKDAFSSYHCKVCMLWIREKTPREMWSNENLLYCLILCIRQLYEWATVGFCPDYFIAKNNIYDRKIIGKVRVSLAKILGFLLSTDCSFLLGIQCCHLGQILTNTISGLEIRDISTTPFIITEEHIEYDIHLASACNCRRFILSHIPQYYGILLEYLERIMFASKRLSRIMQYPLKHAMLIMWSQLGFQIAAICKENTRFLSNDQVGFLVALASGCLSLGINSDVTSVRLKLCGLGLELGKYDLTEVSLQHISDYRMRYMYSATVDVRHNAIILKCNMNAFEEILRTKRFSTEELMQTQVSFSVIYIQSEISITPTPLRMEMFRSIGAPRELRHKYDSWYDWGVVDSLICLNFFQYLNFSRQGKERHKQTAMDNMIHVIRTEPNILHRDTALNLLGYCFIHENQLSNAFTCFTLSLNIRPYHNAAKFYLGLVFMRVIVTHRRHVLY